MVDQLYSISYTIPIQNIWIILCISFPIFTADPCVEVSILILVVYCPVFAGKIQFYAIPNPHLIFIVLNMKT